MIRVTVKGLAYDLSGNPIVLLIDHEEERVLPIWVGLMEVHAIAVVMENMEMPRPLTHDLLKTVCDRVGAQINRVVITNISDNTFYAEIHLAISGNEMIIDSRPSDALALALRASAPIYLTDHLAQEMMLLKDIIDEETREEIEKIFNSDAYREIKKTLH